jgi:hypothetical protein
VRTDVRVNLTARRLLSARSCDSTCQPPAQLEANPSADQDEQRQREKRDAEQPLGFRDAAELEHEAIQGPEAVDERERRSAGDSQAQQDAEAPLPGEERARDAGEDGCRVADDARKGARRWHDERCEARANESSRWQGTPARRGVCLTRRMRAAPSVGR